MSRSIDCYRLSRNLVAMGSFLNGNADPMILCQVYKCFHFQTTTPDVPAAAHTNCRDTAALARPIPSTPPMTSSNPSFLTFGSFPARLQVPICDNSQRSRKIRTASAGDVINSASRNSIHISSRCWDDPRHLPESEHQLRMEHDLHDELWPVVASTMIGGSVAEYCLVSPSQAPSLLTSAKTGLDRGKTETCQVCL
jgi:hypothetical protein